MDDVPPDVSMPPESARDILLTFALGFPAYINTFLRLLGLIHLIMLRSNAILMFVSASFNADADVDKLSERN